MNPFFLTNQNNLAFHPRLSHAPSSDGSPFIFRFFLSPLAWPNLKHRNPFCPSGKCIQFFFVSYYLLWDSSYSAFHSKSCSRVWARCQRLDLNKSWQQLMAAATFCFVLLVAFVFKDWMKLNRCQVRFWCWKVEPVVRCLVVFRHWPRL